MAEAQYVSRTDTSRPAELAEVLIFLALIVPSMLMDFFLFRQQKTGFILVAWATMVRDLTLVCLILFFLWRARESVRAIGWVFEHAWREVALGAVLYVPFFFATGYLAAAFESAGLSGPKKPAPAFLEANGTAQLILAAALVVVVAISEETIFRGYLILRFNQLTRSTVVAVVLSSVIFAMGHGYEGTSGVATVGVMGLIFAIIYLWRKSLVAPMVMHFLQDFIGIVIVPWLTKGH